MSRPKADRPPGGGSGGGGSGGQHLSHTSGDQSKMGSSNPHIRSLSSSGSSSNRSGVDNQYKARSHSSMPQSGQIPAMKERHSMGNSNGSLGHGNSIKGDFKHDKMKINPAPIGLVNSANASASQMDLMRKQSGHIQKHPHAPYTSKHGSRSSIQPHIKQQPSNQSKPALQSQPPQPQPPSLSHQPSFSLLDESALSTESLKTSPTAETKPKQSSIFSPEYMSTATPITVPPPRSSGGYSNNNLHRNSSNNNLNSFKLTSEKKQQQPQLMMNPNTDNHIDFLKQEKIGAEPPQQLLATKETPQVKQESAKKRPLEDDQIREVNKMRRLEARLEGLPPDIMPPEELLAPKLEPEIKKDRSSLPPNDQPNSAHIPENMKPRVVIPKLEKDERLASRLNRPTADTAPQTITSNPITVQAEKPKPSLPVNGLETNPAVISSLLKESLFSDTNKHNTILPISETPGPQLLSDSLSTSYTTPSGGGSDLTDHHHRSKNEKKKKKEKHKHKDRSKDKEERKKHKKDKERHRERHHDSHSQSSSGGGAMLAGENALMPSNSLSKPVASQQHLKLMIKNAPSDGSGSLKIKIPKEKIKPPDSESLKLPKLKINLKNHLQPQSSGNSNNS